jgi:16S rRNA (guanine527-N7)-methyltransferase
MSGMTREQFAALAGVSRETLERLTAYVDLLIRWQKKINLVGEATLSDAWQRHVLDSAQLRQFVGPGVVLDVGSGAGFPGLVLAILGTPYMNLLDSDQRKCMFLREAARVCETEVSVHCVRVEQFAGLPPATITARAFAPLRRLLHSVRRHVHSETRLVLLKGQDVASEIAEATIDWSFRHSLSPSLSSDRGRILLIEEIKLADPIR